jgi:hypothetical protein
VTSFRFRRRYDLAGGRTPPTAEDDVDKKAKTPKKPKQNKAKGAASK